VCVDELDALSTALATLAAGSVTLVEGRAGTSPGAADTLANRVRGPAAVTAPLGRVRTTASLADALRARATLTDGQSLITREGEWLGRDWLRVSRGADPRAGALGRERRLKGLRAAAAASEERPRGAAACRRRARDPAGGAAARARTARRPGRRAAGGACPC